MQKHFQNYLLQKLMYQIIFNLTIIQVSNVN